MPNYVEGHLTAGEASFALVVSRFNEFVTESLLDGALDALRRHGADLERVTVVRCPGAYEVPLVAKKLAASGEYAAVVCLGAVIRGATPHFEAITSGVAAGVQQAALETGVPVIFGILTTDTVEQAIERAGTKAGNKGADAARAALEVADLLGKL